MTPTILLDLGNVLLYFDHMRMCRQIAAIASTTEQSVYSVLFEQSDLLARYEAGHIEDDEVVAELSFRLGRQLDESQLFEAASDIFWSNESMDRVVDALKSSGHTLVMVSNTSAAHVRWIRPRFPVFHRFDHWALSFQVGHAKPSSRIFEAACEMAETDPGDCIFVDDTLGHVQAAGGFGMDAIQYIDTPGLTAQLRQRGIDVATETT